MKLLKTWWGNQRFCLGPLHALALGRNGYFPHRAPQFLAWRNLGFALRLYFSQEKRRRRHHALLILDDSAGRYRRGWEYRWCGGSNDIKVVPALCFGCGSPPSSD